MLPPRGLKQRLGLLVILGTVSLLPTQAIALSHSLASHSLAGAQLTAPMPAIAPTLVAQNGTIATTIRHLEKSRRRWIEIKLASQRLIAWEGKTPVYAILISTGKDSTPTYPGVFAIQTHERYARMKGVGYDVTDVPYTMYYDGSYAIHGAYWHHRFGTAVSHGCINLAVNHARWLFNWARIGTPVVVRR